MEMRDSCPQEADEARGGGEGVPGAGSASLTGGRVSVTQRGPETSARRTRVMNTRVSPCYTMSHSPSEKAKLFMAEIKKKKKKLREK